MRWDFLYLSQEDCIAAGGTDMRGTMKAVERSFLLHGCGDYIQPDKPVIRWGGPETEETIGRIMSMPSWLGGKRHEETLLRRDLLGPVGTAGIKFIPSRPSNPKEHGLPRASALIVILDAETLHPACVMDGAIVSAMRTGAASGVAAKYLANPESQVMGLVGASVQGHTQLMAMKAGVPGLKLCKVFDLNSEVAQRFVERMKGKVGLALKLVSTPEEAIRDSDVISTATTASAPYVQGEWYKAGVFHAEISFWDTPPQALRFLDKIFVDDWHQVRHHGVDVSWRAVRDGFIAEDRIAGNFGEVVAGTKPGRDRADQRIFFNPIGMAIHDLSEAFRVYQNAIQKGIGTQLPLFRQSDHWLETLSLGASFP